MPLQMTEHTFALTAEVLSAQAAHLQAFDE